MAGRRRKKASRYKSGRITKEARADEVMQVAIEARMRHLGVTKSAAKDERLGFPLGRLRRKRYISDSQYEAGLEFERVMRAYVPMLKTIAPEAKSGLKVSPISSLLAATPPERVERAEERARLFMEGLRIASLRSSKGRTATAVVWAICMAHEDEHLSPYELGVLREGLNEIIRVAQRQVKPREKAA